MHISARAYYAAFQVYIHAFISSMSSLKYIFRQKIKQGWTKLTTLQEQGAYQCPHQDILIGNHYAQQN